jgi:hypothetical protein
MQFRKATILDIPSIQAIAEETWRPPVSSHFDRGTDPVYVGPYVQFRNLTGAN